MKHNRITTEKLFFLVFSAQKYIRHKEIFHLRVGNENEANFLYFCSAVLEKKSAMIVIPLEVTLEIQPEIVCWSFEFACLLWQFFMESDIMREYKSFIKCHLIHNSLGFELVLVVKHLILFTCKNFLWRSFKFTKADSGYHFW